jgi:hypothetical protein
VQLPAAPPHTGPELKSSRRGAKPRRPVETNGSRWSPTVATASKRSA